MDSRVALTKDSRRVLQAVILDWQDTAAGKASLALCDSLVKQVWNDMRLAKSDIEVIVFKLAESLA